MIKKWGVIMNKDDLMQKIKKVGADVATSTIDSIKTKAAIKKVGVIYIDQHNKLFSIDQNVGKKGHFVSKASLALLTGGLTLVGEAASKGIKNLTKQWFSFEQLKDYDYIVNNERVRVSEGGRVRLAKGLYVGGTSSISKSVTSSSYFELMINDLDNPYIKIPIINKPLKGKEFEEANKLAKETEGALNFILENK